MLRKNLFESTPLADQIVSLSALLIIRLNIAFLLIMHETFKFMSLSTEFMELSLTYRVFIIGIKRLLLRTIIR